MASNPRFLDRIPGGEKGIHKCAVRDQMADKLSCMIQSGLRQPGVELPSERALGETLKVSRESVRGAIAVGTDRGMVEVSQGARTRIVGTVGMTLVDLVRSMSTRKTHHPKEVNAAREHVATQLVHLAVARISQADQRHFAAWSRCKSKC
jgi:DNA-binding FadR family transcriptional regulator